MHLSNWITRKVGKRYGIFSMRGRLLIAMAKSISWVSTFKSTRPWAVKSPSMMTSLLCNSVEMPQKWESQRSGNTSKSDKPWRMTLLARNTILWLLKRFSAYRRMQSLSSALSAKIRKGLTWYSVAQAWMLGSSQNSTKGVELPRWNCRIVMRCWKRRSSGKCRTIPKRRCRSSSKEKGKKGESGIDLVHGGRLKTINWLRLQMQYDGIQEGLCMLYLSLDFTIVCKMATRV